jgi:hypothetical protein
MVGIAQDQLDAQLVEVLEPYRLYAAIGSHRHKYRRVHRSVRQGNAAGSGFASAVLMMLTEYHVVSFPGGPARFWPC